MSNKWSSKKENGKNWLIKNGRKIVEIKRNSKMRNLWNANILGLRMYAASTIKEVVRMANVAC